MALQKIQEDDSGLTASNKIFDNDTELKEAIEAQIEATQLARETIVEIQNALYKYGVIDSLNRVIFGIDASDNIDGAGVTDRLARSLATTLFPIMYPDIFGAISPQIKDAIGYTEIQNVTYKYGILSSDLKVLFGIDASDNIDGAGVTDRFANSLAVKLAPLLVGLMATDLLNAISPQIKDAVGYTEIQNALYKYGVIDSLNRVIFGIDASDNIDGAGVTDRLGQAISKKTGEYFGLELIGNTRYIWGVLDYLTNKVLLGLNQDGELEALIPALDKIVYYARNYKTDVIVCFGDSLTAGAGVTAGGMPYPSWIQEVVGSKYSVINAGVGGESVAGISARCGGVPALFSQGFTLPADGSAVVVSSKSNIRLTNRYGANVEPLLQGDGNTVNPLYVNGIECTLAYTGTAWNDPAGTWTLRRNTAGARDVQIFAGTPLVFKGAHFYRKIKASVYFMGQNGGYATNAQLVEYLRQNAEYQGQSNYIVVGLHTGTPADRLALETLCRNEFGNRYLNLREYASSQMLYDLGVTPTSTDLTYMNAGTFPPSLWSSPTDSIHGNNLFYEGVGRKVAQMLEQLNCL